jgi:small subunit ribosomal protein S1
MVQMVEEGSGEEEPRSSMADLMDEGYDYRRPRRGDIRSGTVVRIDPDAIIVDIGGKRDGIVPSRDLERLGPEVIEGIRVGDEVRVYIMHPETRDGDTIVSLNLARQAMDWENAQKLMESGEIFEGEVSGYNKGGLIVPFGRLQGFVPASQIVNLNGRVGGGSHLERLAQMVGQELPLKVIEVSRHRRRLIMSERAAQREWRAQQRERLFEDIQEGEVRQGVVSNLCDFGAFVDLGGADGLVHISELAWNRVKHPREVLKIGQEVEVLVLKADRDRQRIALSLKRLQADPWREVEDRYHVDQLVTGTITNVVKFGAFAELEPGIEGLIHISELMEGGAAEPVDVVQEGEQLTLQILSIDSARQRIGLSLRRVPVGEGAVAGGAAAEEPSGEPAPVQELAVEEPATEIGGVEELPGEAPAIEELPAEKPVAEAVPAVELAGEEPPDEIVPVEELAVEEPAGETSPAEELLGEVPPVPAVEEPWAELPPEVPQSDLVFEAEEATAEDLRAELESAEEEGTTEEEAEGGKGDEEAQQESSADVPSADDETSDVDAEAGQAPAS